MSTETHATDLPEQAQDSDFPTNGLPLKVSLKLGYLFSLLIALFTAIASIATLMYPDRIYPTAELRQTFLANDVVNLFIGLPILLGSMWLARRGKLIGLLFWPGDGEVVKGRLAGHVPERLAGGVLIGFGILFMLRVFVVMAGSLSNQTPIAGSELGLLVADFIFSGALLIGGILLWRRQALGYVGGTGLLFQASMLFIGLIAFMILQPFLSDAPFLPLDVIVVFVMGLICFIPFALFLRGVVKS
jgi:hypothetical protein